MLRIADNRRHFIDAHGNSALWLADTAWNGVLRSEENDWRQYLQTRREQGFNVIQFVTTQWRGCTAPPIGTPLRIEGERATIDEDVFAEMDRRIAMVAEHGLIPCPVMFWSLWKSDVGQMLDEASLIDIGKQMLERWSRHEPVWFLGGDGDYTGEVTDKWRRVGRAIFGDDSDQIVTMHPRGTSWVGDLFADEPWYSFVGIQSGHGSGERHLDFLLRGPWSEQWRQIEKPFVNLEPNYEGHPTKGGEARYTAYHVRRATYWSLLTTPPAGITYGNNEIWSWMYERGLIEGHEGIGPTDPWHTGVETEGIAHLQVLKRIFETLPWTQLRPSPDLLAHQPGETSLERFLTVAATPEHDTVLAYTPCGDTIELTGNLPTRARWIDPRTGEAQSASADAARFTPPSATDWLLALD